MPKTKLYNLLINLAILANLVVGFLQIHWAVIIVFVVIHAVLRLAYLNAESELAAHQDNATKTSSPLLPFVISPASSQR